MKLLITSVAIFIAFPLVSAPDSTTHRIPSVDGISGEKIYNKQEFKLKVTNFDVLSDYKGFSFHRFQILAWTLVLGIIFIMEVLSNLRMPEFDDTKLALMGISSGTYIGFKFPEQQAD